MSSSYSQEQFLKDLARWEKRLKRVISQRRAVLAGEARVVRHWRQSYREKKIREVEGHWVRRVVPLDYTPRRRKR